MYALLYGLFSMRDLFTFLDRPKFLIGAEQKVNTYLCMCLCVCAFVFVCVNDEQCMSRSIEKR